GLAAFRYTKGSVSCAVSGGDAKQKGTGGRAVLKAPPGESLDRRRERTAGVGV
ncbi:hypothetical protein U1Q18_049849, partial [Sarracenia purpurea var. burkii]